MSQSFLWALNKQGGAGYVRLGSSMPLGWLDTFVLGTTEPVGGVNVGAGVFEGRAFPTQTITTGGAVSYNSGNGIYTITSGTYEDLVIPGFVQLSAGVVLINCHIKATVTEQTSERQLAQGPTTSGQAELRFCTIDPQTPSPFYNGMSQGIKAVRCWIKNCTDGIKAYSASASGARIRGEGCLIDNLSQFRPDYADDVPYRPETHNDGIQFHNTLDAADVSFLGCKFNGRHSLTAGDVPATQTQIAAVMFTVIGGGESHGSFDYCWFLGGMYCVNAGSDSAEMADSSLSITNSRFERPGTDEYGDSRAPAAALAIDSSLNFTDGGNTYIDNGQPVPITPA